MNGYSELLRYMHNIGKPLVNTITQGDFTKVDQSKKDIFPLLHIAVGDATFPSPGTIRFSVQVGCFDIRDITKEINADKYYNNDNEIDNMNSTLAILNRIWQSLRMDFDGGNVAVSEMPTLADYHDSNENLLDGWIMDFDITMPNVMIDLCQ